MAAYQVTVPFVALLYESLDATLTTELPEAFELPGIVVTRRAPGHYAASMQVAAQNATQAKRVAVERVRQALRLMATLDLGFTVDLG